MTSYLSPKGLELKEKYDELPLEELLKKCYSKININDKDLNLDLNTIITGLLHDVVEDCEISLKTFARDVRLAHYNVDTQNKKNK